jgi:serine/threonine protein kinase
VQTKSQELSLELLLRCNFVHSGGVIHRDLKHDNILLDWDWNVRIADFGQSMTLNGSDRAAFVHPNRDRSLPSIDSRYLAPECYDSSYSQRSDVFSFGFILSELLTGQPTFSKELTDLEIMFRVAVKNQ